LIETHKTNLEKKRSSQIFKPSKNHRQSEYAINPRRRQLGDYQEFWIEGVSCPVSEDQGMRFDSQTKESLELKFDALTDAINAQTIELKAQSAALGKLKTQSAAHQNEMKALSEQSAACMIELKAQSAAFMIELKAQSAAHQIEMKAQSTAQALDVKAQGVALDKRQRLEWGFANSEIDVFYLYKSSVLVRLILLAFRRGKGYDIGSSVNIQGVSESDCKSFRDRLGNQIEDLVGVTPRFEQDVEGKYWIYYE
jgi:hypothetical protein